MERVITRNRIRCPHCTESQYGTETDIDDMEEETPYTLVCNYCERPFVVTLCRRDYWFHTSRT